MHSFEIRSVPGQLGIVIKRLDQYRTKCNKYAVEIPLTAYRERYEDEF